MSTRTVPTGDAPPNVLWIMSDQHNAKCTPWGRFPMDVHAPNLERLADSGVRFDRAICQNPICTPSRTSYLTGQYPSNHGIYGLTGDGGQVDAPTIFSALRERGYRTGAFGKLHTPRGLIENQVDRGWSCYDFGGPLQQDHYQRYLERRGLADQRDDDRLLEWDGGGQGLDARPSALPYERQPEAVAVQEATSFIDDATERDDPYVAWVSLPRPHQVYTPSEEYWSLYDGDVELPPTAFEDLADKPPHQTNRQPDEETPHAAFEQGTQAAFLERKLQGYLGCVSMVDAYVGELLDHLEAAGIREDTIVIYCADHGDFAAEHGLPEKAPGISYDAITRIPFIWSWPGRFRSGAVVDELVETVDVFPTLLAILGESATPSADGGDLTGLLTGADESPIRDYAITENAWARTIRTKDQKLTVYPPGFFGDDSEAYLECYDLAADPWEQENLAVADDPPTDVIDRHRRYLESFLLTARRAQSTLSVDRSTTGLTDGTLHPDRIRDHLAERTGDNYL